MPARSSKNRFPILRHSGKNAEDAIHAAHRIQFPVVIKPATRTAEGVTIGIDSDALV